MFSKQREAGQIMIKSHAAGPGFGIVTATALRTELAGVRILFCVAAAAFGRQFKLIRRLCVACFAARHCVLSGQRELGHRVVIKTDRFPVCWSVALRAVLPVTAFVGVIRCMAAIAADWRFHDLGGLLVTSFASRRAMGSLERELGHPVMIKTGLPPTARAVAAGAIGTILTFVAIIFGMTADTGPCGVLVGVAWPVALGAGGSGVAPDQRKSGCRMVECRRTPGSSSVARGTVGAAIAAMGVVAGMARIAGGRQVLPALSSVAAHAALAAMRSG